MAVPPTVYFTVSGAVNGPERRKVYTRRPVPFSVTASGATVRVITGSPAVGPDAVGMALVMAVEISNWLKPVLLFQTLNVPVKAPLPMIVPAFVQLPSRAATLSPALPLISSWWRCSVAGRV